jgi:hypothetical protein
MTMKETREQIIQELDSLSESSLNKVLELIRTLKDETLKSREDRVWQAYLDSVREREEVYRRLAE